jgi:thiol-disulfide isomerase/thioredoxin
MDRLHALTLALAVALGAGCGDDAETPAAGDEPVGRFAAVKARNRAPQVDAFCDVHPAEASAPAFAWPALEGSGAAPAAGTRWRWVNVWATWCAPCVEEMPRLTGFRDRLGRDGVPLELTFISVDGSDDAVTRWRAAHPGTPDTLRIADPGLMAAWFQSAGLDAAAPIPVHLFVDPQQRVRCARAGAIDDDDYATIAAILRGG